MEEYIPNPNIIDESEFKKTIKIEETVDNSQQIIINGKVVKNQIKRSALCCPSCNEIIQPLNVSAGRRREIIDFCNKNASLLEKYIPKCPKCGQKLSYSIDVIEGEFSEKTSS